jgi:hypothetical protein
MFSNRFALPGLALACIAAAGVGGYFATRQNVAGLAAPTASASAAPAVSPSQPVQETEALVSPSAAPTPAAQTRTQVPVSSATTRRPETAARAAARQPEPEAVAVHTAEPPALDRTLPSGTPSAPTPATAPGDAQAPTPRIEDRPADIPAPPDPPAKSFEELVVTADSVVGLQTETALSSERARVEDRVDARVVRDVRVGGAVAISAGTRALGTVVVVERGGKFKERARLGIRFQTLVLADGTRLPITTETIYRYGDAPGNASAARIGGGAVVGAIIGGIIGGGKGAAIGATTGAGAGTASVMSGDHDAAVIPAGAEVTARILSPVTITIEKE